MSSREDESHLESLTGFRYRNFRRVGAGGMSTVYAVEDKENSREVALKLLKRDPLSTDEGERRRLRMKREAQALKLLSHPNIVRVFEVGDAGDQMFITMELIQGSALREWIREKPRSLREILDVFLAAGKGLLAAHERGLVHRDFKPGNVLVSQSGRVVVTDFGLVRFGPELEQLKTMAGTPQTFAAALGAPLTAPGAVIGTPGYMAPEQIQGQATDQRTDQFAYCIALYEALYGERPFLASSQDSLPAEIALALAVVQGDVRPAPEGSAVPKELREILLRGLSARPEDRYPSMGELLEQLAAFDDTTLRGPVLVLAGTVALLAIGAAIVVAMPPPDPCASLARPSPAEASGMRARYFEEYGAVREILCGPAFANDLGARQSAVDCLGARLQEAELYASATEVQALGMTPPVRCAEAPHGGIEGRWDSSSREESAQLDALFQALAANDDLSRARVHLTLAKSIGEASAGLQSERLYQRTGDGPRAVHQLHALGHLYASVGRTEDAGACFRAAARAAEKVAGGAAHTIADFESAGQLELARGRPGEALVLFTQAELLFSRTGNLPPDLRARVQAGLAVASLRAGDPTAAASAALASIAEIETVETSAQVEQLVSAANILARAAERTVARGALERAVARGGQDLAAARAAHAYGELLAADGSLEKASDHLLRAVGIAERVKLSDDVVLRDALAALGLIELERGAADAAIGRTDRALELSRRNGDSGERSARIRFAHARALSTRPAAKGEALSLAKSAYDELSSSTVDEDRLRAEEIAAWIAAVE